MYHKQNKIVAVRFLGLLLLCGGLLALRPALASPPDTSAEETATAPKASPSTGQRVGPGDQIAVRALHANEISDRPFRIDEQGFIRLPLVGKLRAGGLTVDQLAETIREKLSALIRDPEVSVDVVESRSHPVSVMGAVKVPGVYEMQGRKRLLDVLSMAGGVEADCGHAIRISRMKAMGEIPLAAGAVSDSGEYFVGEIKFSSLIEAKRPEDNIEIFPRDVITVPRAKLVYVVGEVRRSGGFVLRESESLSVLQALSLAEGTIPTANTSHAKIRRTGAAGATAEIAVDLKKILNGKAEDIGLLPNDVLIVPKSGAKTAAFRTIDTAIAMGTGIVVWRR